MTLKFPGRKKEISFPAVMGILNVTPDSFFDGGKYRNDTLILYRAEEILSEEGDIIDIGAVSTRPNAPVVPEEEELKRLIPAIQLVRGKFPGVIVSADTFRSRVAKEAIRAGADMINDISGGTMDETMFETVAKLDSPYVLMHIKGTPQTMQQDLKYDDVVAEVMDYFVHRVNLAVSAGIRQLIIDPGFGFGKTMEHNYILLKNLSQFRKFGFPVLAGISRKSMLNKLLGITTENALNATTAAHAIALLHGADILRVHDVKEAKETAKIINFVNHL